MIQKSKLITAVMLIGTFALAPSLASANEKQTTIKSAKKLSGSIVTVKVIRPKKVEF